MKTNKTKKRTSIEREMFNLFKEIYEDEDSQEEAVRDSIRAYSYIRQEALNRNINPNDSE